MHTVNVLGVDLLRPGGAVEVEAAAQALHLTGLQQGLVAVAGIQTALLGQFLEVVDAGLDIVKAAAVGDGAGNDVGLRGGAAHNVAHVHNDVALHQLFPGGGSLAVGQGSVVDQAGIAGVGAGPEAVRILGPVRNGVPAGNGVGLEAVLFQSGGGEAVAHVADVLGGVVLLRHEHGDLLSGAEIHVGVLKAVLIQQSLVAEVPVRPVVGHAHGLHPALGLGALDDLINT